MATMYNIPTVIRELDDIVCKIKTYNSADEREVDIVEIVENNLERLFKADACMESGKNVFHILAEEPDRSDSILKLFNLGDVINAENISEADLETLLKMPYGGQGFSPLHLAVQNEFMSFTKILLSLHPDLIRLPDNEGNTSLHMAVNSNTELVGTILAQAEKLGVCEEILMEKRNEKGYTPIHLLCSNIPANADSDISARLQKLLSHDCTKDILKPHVASKLNPIHLLCSGSDNSVVKDDTKNPNLAKCLKILIQDNDDVNLPTGDASQMTALHLACRNQLPNLTEILVQHPKINVTIRDSAGKMAIHYAAETSNKPKGHQCLRVLADWSKLESKIKYKNLERRDSFISYLLRDTTRIEYQRNDPSSWFCCCNRVKSEQQINQTRDENASNNTSSRLCCNRKKSEQQSNQTSEVNASSNTSSWFCFNRKKSTEAYELQICEGEVIRNVHDDLNINKKELPDTALTLCCKAKSTKSVEYILRNVYDASPRFETWFSENRVLSYNNSMEQIYEQTPEVLEFLFEKAISIDLEESTETELKFTTDISVITGVTTPSLKSPVTEMTYLKKAENWPKDISEKILLHPLTKCVLLAVWRKMFLYKVFWTIINVFWLLLYYILVPYEFSTSEKSFPSHQIIAAWILAIITIVHALLQLMEIIKRRGQCLSRVSFLATSMKLVLTAIAVCYPCFGCPPDTIAKYSAATGAVLSNILFWRNLSIIYLPLGMQVEYLVETLKRILVAILCVTPVIFGFEKAFRQILSEHFANDDSSLLSLTKLLVMMTGEFEYNDLFQENNNTTDMNEEEIVGMAKAKTLNLILFISFLLIVSISFYNLITGLVVEKVTNMTTKIETHIICNQIRVIHDAQQSIVTLVWDNSITPRILNYFFISYSPIERKGQQNLKVKYELQWYIDKNSPKKSICSRIKNIKNSLSFLSNDNNRTCGNELPSSVKRKLFDMYEMNLKDNSRN